MRIALLLGLRTLTREWRAGDLAVLFLALLVAVVDFSRCFSPTSTAVVSLKNQFGL